MISVSQQQKRALAVATAAAIVLGIYFLKNYTLLIAFAAIVAYSFNPIYKRLLKRWGKPGRAATVTLLLTFVALIIPLAIVIVITSYQVIHLVDVIKHAGQSTNFNEIFTNTINYINQLLDKLGIPYQLNQQAVLNQLSSFLKTLGENIVGGITGAVSSIGAFISTFIIYIYVFISLLVNQDKLIETFHQLNPLGRQISKLYADRTAIMTRSMVRGQFIIAAVQGFTDALFLYLAGMHSTFFFFFVLLTVLSIIPLGGGVIVIPIGIIMLLTGQIWQGLLVLAGHLLVVTNEDNILRPRLVPSEARLDPALTLLSVFSGLAFFGFLGIVLGPIVMILIVTTIEVYLDVYKNISSPKKDDDKKNRRLLARLQFWKQSKA